MSKINFAQAKNFANDSYLKVEFALEQAGVAIRTSIIMKEQYFSFIVYRWFEFLSDSEKEWFIATIKEAGFTVVANRGVDLSMLF